MAGGEGRRLRAVSHETPKPMVPLLGRPILEHIVLLLKEQGFHDLCMTLRYRAEEIQNYFGDGSRFGVSLTYRTETQALGTAGGVKNCEDFYQKEPFLVISGDAICDFPLRELMRRHCQERPAASLALYKSACPLRYGVTVTDDNDHVCCFIEKPDWSRVVSNMINTGIYVIDPRVMHALTPGQSADFAKDLFPLLLQRKEILLGVPMEGYWCDIGTPLSYYHCCVDALEGKLSLHMGESFLLVSESSPVEREEDGVQTLCPCRDRAALMGALSRSFLEMGASYKDGIRLSGKGYRLHIAPLASRSALRISVRSPDAEFARRLAFSARELAEAFGL